MAIAETSGERIRRARKAAGLTQKQIAAEVGVTDASVSQWENGDTKSLKPEHLFRLARVLGKNAEWLATGDGPEHDGALLADALEDLPAETGQGILDFIQYRIERAEEFIASDKMARYVTMIESIKNDLAHRRKKGR